MAAYDTSEEIERHLEKLDTILSNVPAYERSWLEDGPAQILDHLYLGDYGHASSIGQLSELGITHVLNCAGAQTTSSGHRRFSGISSVRGHLHLEADDNANYDMLKHLTDARGFINSAKLEGGKVMVYCAKGMNRSVTLCIAYLILDQSLNLFHAVRMVAQVRGRILTNPGFRRQLVTLALEERT